MSRLRQLFQEIHHRSMWQVLGIYLASGWVGLQLVDILVDSLGLPQWLPALAILLIAIGIPIVMATAFVQRGFSRKTDVAGGEAEHAVGRRGTPNELGRFFTWRNSIAAGVTAFALWGAFALGWVVLGGGPGTDTAAEGTPTVDDSESALPGTISIYSEPAGAAVTAIRVDPDGSLAVETAMDLGGAVGTERSLPSGEYLIRFEAEDWNTLELLVSVGPDEPVSVSGSLAAADELTNDMVLVGGGTYPGAPEGRVVPTFFMDRHEVTNAQYLEFVSAGGYSDPALWPETTTIETFVDQTDLPGPRDWSGSLYPEGKGDHPVAGISWYEASAYARWVGKELPSWDQWWRAALGDRERAFPWGDDVLTAEGRANFGMMDTEPVGSHASGVSPFGVHDMAGNVREWLRGMAGEPPRARTVGGSWNAPPYTFERSHASQVDPLFSSSSIGFRCVRPASDPK